MWSKQVSDILVQKIWLVEVGIVKFAEVKFGYCNRLQLYPMSPFSTMASNWQMKDQEQWKVSLSLWIMTHFESRFTSKLTLNHDSFCDSLYNSSFDSLWIAIHLVIHFEALVTLNHDSLCDSLCNSLHDSLWNSLFNSLWITVHFVIHFRAHFELHKMIKSVRNFFISENQPN